MALQVRKPTLAIEGGSPVRSSYLAFGEPCIGEEEIQEVLATLQEGWIGSGPRTINFETDFADYVGAPHAASVNSCTAALFLGLKMLGIGPGDAVITSPLTFAASANVIEHVGARPLFVDINPQTLNIDPLRVEELLNSRARLPGLPRPRAIIPVHFGGLPCEMDALREVASRWGLELIEDAAHAIGARYRGKMIGSVSPITCFSFYANKNLTTAEGGMITTSAAELDERLRILRLHGLQQDAWKRFGKKRIQVEISEPGFKFNMPDLNAALGLHQLRKQEAFLEIRERYAARFDAAFADLPVARQPRPEQIEQDRHALHLYVLLLDLSALRVGRDQVVDSLIAENIGAAIHYQPLHTQPWYRTAYNYRADDFPLADAAGKSIFSLPLTPGMREKDVDDVIEAVCKVVRAYQR